LRVSPIKGVKRVGVKGKLAPHYIGSFSILEKCETMAYKLDLPLSLPRIHGILNMLQLKKCLKALVDAVIHKVTPLGEQHSPSAQLGEVVAYRLGIRGVPSTTWHHRGGWWTASACFRQLFTTVDGLGKVPAPRCPLMEA
jgi:hypothetical protein